MATHPSILPQRIPWTEESGRLQSMGHKESDTAERLHFLSFFPFSKITSRPIPVAANGALLMAE